ncbi:MAG: efflux RND transporter permease subunit [Clostridia bacterium]|nr:efflux RND transporter permease subunit [Clostridia bacterium]
MISKYSVQKPITVLMAIVIVIVLGVVSFMNMTTDLFPSMDFPYLVMYVAYGGASPEKVETMVSKPVESAIATLSGVQNVQSIAMENVGITMIELDSDADMDSTIIELSSLVDAALATINDDGIGTPVYMKINPDVLPIMVLSVSAAGREGAELTEYVNEVIIPALERTDGVASVEASGLTEEKLYITLSSDKIDALNDKLLTAIDSELLDVQKQLEDGRKEIENGYLELDKQLNEGQSTIDAGWAEIRAGKAQIQAAYANLSVTERELNAQLDELTIQREQLSALIEGAENLTQLEAALLLAEYALENQAAVIAAAQSRLDELYAERDAITEELEALPEGEEYDDERETLMQRLELINEQIDIAERSMEALLEAFSELQIQYNTLKEQYDMLVAALAELGNPSVDELNEMLAQIDSGIAQCQDGLLQIAQARAELDAAMAEIVRNEALLEQGQLDLDIGIEEARAMLDEAAMELDAAEEEFNAARDEALKQADVGGMITPSLISGILMGDNYSLPAGYIYDGEMRYSLKIGEPFSSVDEISGLELMTMDVEGMGTIKLIDVADVEIHDNSNDSFVRVNGEPGLLLTLSKQSNYSTTAVSNALDDTIEELNSDGESGVFTLMDQGTYIDIIIGSVISNILMGGVLAVIVLFLFLKSIRSTFIVAVSIPISILLSLVLMYFTNVSLNILSLGGLALGVGMLVDNSIVTIENIFRLRMQGMSAAKAAVSGAKQISGPIIASTLTTISVFLPIIFTEGITKQMFTDMGLTIAYSLVSSLIVALTLVPTMSSTMLRNVKPKEDGKLYKGFIRVYEKTLKWALSHRLITMVACLLLFAISIGLLVNMGTEFIPQSDFSEITVSVEFTEELTESEQRSQIEDIASEIRAMEYVDVVGAMQGSSGIMSASDSASSTIYVVLSEDRETTSMVVAQRINELAEGRPCIISASNLVSSMTSMLGSGLQLEIRGDDLDVMLKIADDIKAMLSEIEGVIGVESDIGEAEDEVYITVDKNKALKYGLTVAQVYAQVSEAVKTETDATSASIDNKDYPIIVAVDNDMMIGVDDIMDIEITSALDQNVTVPLGDIAELTIKSGYGTIYRYNYVRTATVTANIDADHNVGLVGREVADMLNSYELPSGYSISDKGENKLINDMISDIAIMVVLAVILIFAIMAAQFQSLKAPAIVLFTIPLAFTGAIFMLCICGLNLSIVALIGVLVLVGVVVNNGIVFVDYTNQLRLEGMDRRNALVETGKARIRPILMTTITTVLGLFTILLKLGTGTDLLQPMAAVIIGGLSYATLLTLYVVPIMYDVISKKQLKVIDVEN